MYAATATIITIATIITFITTIKGEYREGYLVEEVDRGQNCQFRTLAEDLKWERVKNIKLQAIIDQQEEEMAAMRMSGKKMSTRIQELNDILIALGVLCGGLFNFVAFIGYKYCKKAPQPPTPSAAEAPAISSTPPLQGPVPPPPQFRSPEELVPLHRPIPAPRHPHPLA